MTPWQQHVEEWRGCDRCRLCAGRRRVVLARGSLPADLLLIGEAPGESEDVLGRPFAGPAGKLIDQIVAEALFATQVPCTEGPDYNSLRVAFTNLVGCIPREPDSRRKAVEPMLDEIEACAPRLQELVRLANPKLIVRVGRLAKEWLESGYKHSIKFHRDIPMIDVTHPAAILRMPAAGRGLAVRRAVVTIQNAVENLFRG